jgi:hypothetical protein
MAFEHIGQPINLILRTLGVFYFNNGLNSLTR